jgi:hypothetical protein
MTPSTPASAPDAARGILATLWGLSFVAALAIPFVLYARGAIETDGLKPCLEDLSGIYAPHIGAILAYYFATKRRSRAAAMKRTTLLLALAVSVLWNLAVFALILPPLWGGGGLVDATGTAKNVVPQLAWVLGPALGYFFARAAN